MTGSKPLRAVGLLLAWGTLSAGQVFAAEPTQADLDFFEKRIRPLLVEHCYACHGGGEKRTKGGLRLDAREGWSVGGDSGPAIEPGKPDESLLILAVRYGEGLDMPPRGKLPDSAIKDLEQWVERGAADPRTGSTMAKPKDVAAQASAHWAYLPIRSPAPPAVDEAAWPQNDIDRFILARLEERQLRHAGDADRPAIVRRLYYDLIGLPPTPEEIADFIGDESPDAYERLVDRLLASPHFGERWGRHWLSVARFAESITLRGFLFPEAWRYRDYVIETFNDDRPFDRFIHRTGRGRFAAGRVHRTAATAGHRHHVPGAGQHQPGRAGQRATADGRRRRATRSDRQGIPGPDDRLRPLPRSQVRSDSDGGLLRSRRHSANTKTLEHANVSNWLELPLPLPPDQEIELQRQETAPSPRSESELQALQQKLGGTNVVVAKDLPGIIVDDRQAKVVGDWLRSQSVKPYIGDGYLHDQDSGRETRRSPCCRNCRKPGDTKFAWDTRPAKTAATPCR